MKASRSGVRTGLAFLLGTVLATTIMATVILSLPHSASSPDNTDATTKITIPTSTTGFQANEPANSSQPGTQPVHDIVTDIRAPIMGLSLIILFGAVASISTRRLARRKVAGLRSVIEVPREDEPGT